MENKIDSFLHKIAQIESSGGKNINHKTMQSGIQKGDAAIGRYGLMPNTIRELINREKIAGNDSPVLKYLEKMPSDQLTKFVNENADVERMLAETMAKLVLNRFDTEQEAAYAWNMGHNISPEKIKERDVDSHYYVKRFNDINEPTEVDRSVDSVEPVKQFEPETDVKLASNVNAPIPSFSNISNNDMSQYGGLQQLIDLVNRRQKEFRDAQVEGFKEDFNLSDEDAENAAINLDPIGFMGSIKNVANAGKNIAPKMTQFLDEATNPGLRATPKKGPSTNPFVSDGMPNAATEEWVNPDPITRAYNKLNEGKSSIMDDMYGKLKKSKVENLPEETYSKIPVTEEESILKRVSELLNRKK